MRMSASMVVLGKVATGWSTDDGGTWWRPLSLPRRQGGVGALYTATGAVYAVSTSGPFRSGDGGAKWRLLARPTFRETGVRPRLRFSTYDADRLYYAAGFELMMSRDGGATWKEIGHGLGAYPVFSDIAPDPDDPEALYAATPQGLYRRERGVSVPAEGRRSDPHTADAPVEVSQTGVLPGHPADLRGGAARRSESVAEKRCWPAPLASAARLADKLTRRLCLSCALAHSAQLPRRPFLG
jgi:hypothetical protein